MPSVATTEFVRTTHLEAPPFSLIEQKGLLTRLGLVVVSAVGEIARDPVGFLKDVFSSDIKDEKRRKRIYLGLSLAAGLHIVLLGTIAVIGWRAMFVKPVEAAAPEYTIIPISPPTAHNAEPTPPTPKGQGGGGGGGGQLSPNPPVKGTPPPMAPTPPIVNMNPPNIPDPTLAVSPTVMGPAMPPPPPVPIGDPNGKQGPFSGGPGTNGGIGTGNGTGVGGGNDGGVGKGKEGGTGVTPAGSPGGSSIPSAIDWANAKSYKGFRSWSWIKRQSPVITREASENKVNGTVVLRANFNKDGTITDIEVKMGVDFMTQSAVESLRRCTFYPATIDGKPVDVRGVLIRIDVHY